MKSLVLSASCLALFACGGELEPATDDAAPTAELGAPATAVSTLSFYQGWTRTQDGALAAGGQVRVRYEPGRLPDCRGESNGRPAWSLTMFSRLAGGPVEARVIAGLAPDGSTPSGEVVLDLDRAGELELWFQVTNRWGCTAWDSDFGRNFRYPVLEAASATLHFDADFTERVDGQLRAGGAAIIDFDLSRLPKCRQGYNGAPTWDVLVSRRFDGGAVESTPVTRATGNVRASVPTVIAIPEGARELELWFFASDRAGCREYDSDYGRNYRFGW